MLISANTDQMKCVSSPWKVTNKRSAARTVLSILSMSNLIGYLISTFELYFSHLLFKIVDANSNVQTYALLHYGLLEFENTFLTKTFFINSLQKHRDSYNFIITFTEKLCHTLKISLCF